LKNIIFISINRLNDEFLRFIEKNFKDSKNTFVSLFELKNKGMGEIIKSFISYRKYDQVVFIFNDELYRLVEALFYSLSLCILKLNITKVLHDKRYEKVP